MTAPPPTATHPLRDRRVLAWAMYDWANSAYTTLMITVLVAYIQRVVFPTDRWGTTGAVVWAWGISLSMLMGALLSPIVGSIADASGTKRHWLAMTAMTGALAAILIGLISPERYVLVVTLFIIANLMLELSLGIYDGFLPEIASKEQSNTVSAWGYGLGYIGGGVALLVAILLLQFGAHIGLETVTSRLQASLVLMGGWWAVFTLPAVIVLRDRVADASSGTAATGIRDVWHTVLGLRANVPLALFLLSFLFYNDGVQTIISQASTFALQELSFPEADLMAVILMIQFMAFPGALSVGWLADRLGSKTTLLGCLLVWAGVLIAALGVNTKVGFWLLAAVIALVLGGTQAVSRSLMSTMTPEGQSAKYFGFFHLSGKATSFAGPFLFGTIVATTGSSRLAIFGLLPLFAIGAALLLRVKVQKEHSGRHTGCEPEVLKQISTSSQPVDPELMP
jgi:MFS transporter, UMF1 family